MATLYREFDACNECRLEVGGPEKYKVLTESEIRDVLNAFECRTKLTKMTKWLEENQSDHYFSLMCAMNLAKVEELKHECPYCCKEMNSGCPDPSAFACCGEVGHAVEVSHE